METDKKRVTDVTYNIPHRTSKTCRGHKVRTRTTEESRQKIEHRARESPQSRRREA